MRSATQVFGGATVLALALSLAGQGFAQSASSGCSIPVAPVALVVPALAEPVKPAQLACDQNNSCKKAEIEAFNASMTKYKADSDGLTAKQNARIEQANAYIAQLNEFNKTMHAYVECEHDRVAALVQPKAAASGG